MLGAFGAGLVAALSLPPLGFWPMAVVGLGAFYSIVTRVNLAQRLAVGAAFSAGFFGFTLWWIISFNLAGWFLMIAMAATFISIASGFVPNRSSVPSRLTRIAGFTSALALADALRWLWPFGGVPVGSLPLGQAGSPLSPTARVGGPVLLEICLYASSAALAELTDFLIRPRNGPVARIPGTVARIPADGPHDDLPGPEPIPPPSLPSPARSIGIAPAAVLLAVTAIVAVSTEAPTGGPIFGKRLVAVVQGGGVRGLRAINSDAETVYLNHLDPTESLKKGPSLILWPEDVVALGGPIKGSPQAAQLGDISKRMGATLIAGVTEIVSATQFRNAAVAFGPSGRIIGRYDKVHRVPFGEYVPLRSLVRHFVNLSAVPRDAIPGKGPGILRTPAGNFGVMISFEVMFQNRARAAVEAGGEAFLVPTNDSSYSSSQVPSEEVAGDKLRAIEEGRYLVQAAPTGYSDFISPTGVVLYRSQLGKQQVKEIWVPLLKGRTWYSKLGDMPFDVFDAAIFALCSGLVLFRRKGIGA